MFLVIILTLAYIIEWTHFLTRKYNPRIQYIDVMSRTQIFVERHHFNIIDLKYQYLFNEIDVWHTSQSKEYVQQIYKQNALRAFVDQLSQMDNAIVWCERDFKTDPSLRYGEHLVTALAKVVQVDDKELFNKVYGDEPPKREEGRYGPTFAVSPKSANPESNYAGTKQSGNARPATRKAPAKKRKPKI